MKIEMKNMHHCNSPLFNTKRGLGGVLLLFLASFILIVPAAAQTSSNAPFVTITSPVNNSLNTVTSSSTYQANENITITGIAMETGQTIKEVDIYNGAAKLGTAYNDGTVSKTLFENAFSNKAASYGDSIFSSLQTNGYIDSTGHIIGDLTTLSNIKSQFPDNQEFATILAILQQTQKTTFSCILNLPLGTYSLTAHAIDGTSSATAGTSTAVTVTVSSGSGAGPNVTLLTPSNNSIFIQPASINLAAQTTASNINRVEFWCSINGTNTLIGTSAVPVGNTTATANTYSYEWTYVPAGTYSVTAVAYDNSGNSTVSSALSITVTKVTLVLPQPQNDDGTYPPGHNGTYQPGSNILLTAFTSTKYKNAAPPIDIIYSEPLITTVKFYVDSNLVNTTTSPSPSSLGNGFNDADMYHIDDAANIPPAPSYVWNLANPNQNLGPAYVTSAFTYTWPNVSSGTHTIYAVASDGTNNYTSSQVTINVQNGSSGSSVISPSRTINWTPGVTVGVPGGIPADIAMATLQSLSPSQVIDVTQAPYSAPYIPYGTSVTYGPGIVSGGSGYSVGDVLSVPQTGATSATITVTAVDSNKAITAISVNNFGSGYTSGTSALATSGGTGTGATVSMTDGLYTTTTPGSVPIADASPVINSAIAAAQEGQIVYFPKGTYVINSELYILYSLQHLILSGDGPDQTTLVCQTSGSCFGTRNNNVTSYQDLISSGTSKGSNQITVTDPGTYVTGEMIEIAASNDPSLPVLSVYGFPLVRNEWTLVTAINGGNLTINPPLTGGFANAAYIVTGIIANGKPAQSRFIGIENLAVDGTEAPTSPYEGVDIEGYGSWVRNVTVKGMGSYNFILEGLNNEMRHSFVGSLNHAGPRGSGLLLEGSGQLVEDNILDQEGLEADSTIIEGSASANVYAYNFQINNQLDLNHEPHGGYNLFEGNLVKSLESDSYFGSDSDEMFFRNWIMGISYDEKGTVVPANLKDLFTVNNVPGNDGFNIGIWLSSACQTASGIPCLDSSGHVIVDPTSSQFQTNLYNYIKSLYTSPSSPPSSEQPLTTQLLQHPPEFQGSETSTNYPVFFIKRFDRNYSLIGNLLGTSNLYSAGLSSGTFSSGLNMGDPNIGNQFSYGIAQPSHGQYWADWNPTTGAAIAGILGAKQVDSNGVSYWPILITSGFNRLYGDALENNMTNGNGLPVGVDWITSIAEGTINFPNNLPTDVNGLYPDSGETVSLYGPSIYGSSAALPQAGSLVALWPTDNGYQEVDLDVPASTLLQDNWYAAPFTAYDPTSNASNGPAASLYSDLSSGTAFTLASGDGIAPTETLPSGETLPNSLYYNSKPYWFGDRTWPPVDVNSPSGPSESLWALPAGYRYFHNGTDAPSINRQTSTLTINISGLNQADGSDVKSYINPTVITPTNSGTVMLETPVACAATTPLSSTTSPYTTSCSFAIDQGTTLTLTANKGSCSTFTAGWSGPTGCSGSSCSVTMSSNQSVTATFNPIAGCTASSGNSSSSGGGVSPVCSTTIPHYCTTGTSSEVSSGDSTTDYLWTCTVGSINASCDIPKQTGTGSSITAGLNGWWTFSDPGGLNNGIAADSSSNGNNGTLVNFNLPLTSASLTTGIIGNALQFNGTTNYIQLPVTSTHNASVYNRTTGYSISLWEKTTSAGGGTMYSENQSNGVSQVIMFVQGDRIKIWANGGTMNHSNGHNDGYSYSYQLVDDGNWHHIVWTDNNGQAQLYIDGYPDPAYGNTGWNYTPVTSNPITYVAIGADNPGTPSAYFSGSLDDVRVYNMPLTSAEVQSLYLLGQPNPGTVGNGDITNSGTVTMYDAALALIDYAAGGGCTSTAITAQPTGACARAGMDPQGTTGSVDSADVIDIAKKAMGL